MPSKKTQQQIKQQQASVQSDAVEMEGFSEGIDIHTYMKFLQTK